MNVTNLTEQLDGRLHRVLATHQVTVSQPRDRMLQLDAVPVGPDFNHPCTNVLLREGPAGAWQVFVDEDLVYCGGDPSRQALFQSRSRRGWLPLALRQPLSGDVNAAVFAALELLESDVRDAAAPLSGDEPRPAAPCESPPLLLDQRLGQQLSGVQLRPPGIEPTAAQQDAIVQVAETVTRRSAPNCPLLTGPPGCGKTLLARLAAHLLLERGDAQRVVEVRASAISAGAVFLADRDERLRATLHSLAAAPATVVVLEHFELALSRSDVAAALLADALDAGLQLIAVARAHPRPKLAGGAAALRRRLEPVSFEPPDELELIRILTDQLARHPLAGQTEWSPHVIPLIANLSGRRRGANPGAALGLLEAVINRARFTQHRCVGPDDVYHLFADKRDS